MFRYERPQKGRLRQFKQFGIECLGLASSMADIEVISLGYELLSKLNVLEKIDLKINTLGDFESRNNYRNALIDYLKDYKSSLSKESLKRLSINPLRILDSKNEDDQKIIENAPNIIEYLNLESKTRFENICKGLDYLNIEYKIDKNLVRGLDYYCHTAFEFTTNDLGAQGTVLAGGRYDGLSKILGGSDVPGVGWAAGIERLALMVQSEFVNETDVVLIGQTENFNYLLLPIMKELIHQGIKTEIIYTGNLSKKFKRANKINASYAIVLGEEEIYKKKLKLKNLTSGIEELLNLKQVIKKIKNNY
jgi:histidyl-tRNA synthetase